MGPAHSLWAFLLEPLPGERTRLVVSGYWAFRPRWLQGIFGFLFIEPSTWLMQKRQFAGLKRRAERTTARASYNARWIPTPSDRTFS